ncbi:MAG TPA: hypothetical protein VMY78_09865 [Solirubrobacteraceae bacterium]|nr:hypothetical protein [Solirubrobacteraceae bacterium]
MADSGYPDVANLAATVAANVANDIATDTATAIVDARLHTHAYEPIGLYNGAEWDGDGPEPAFWVDGFGICHLRGRITIPAGVPGFPIFFGTVPDVLDGALETFLAPGSAGSAYVQVAYQGTGAAALSYALGDSSAGLWFDISGITYPTP